MTLTDQIASLLSARLREIPGRADGDFLPASDGGPDAMLCAALIAGGRELASGALARVMREGGKSTGDARAAAESLVSELLGGDLRVTGAEAAAVVLAAAGVTTVFAYPGTSELALCDAADRLPGTRLINGRGDKESAFMAAGGSLLRPNRAAAILHGARGLTNAAGAVADARRNEAGTVFLVGLPSSSSARFLPPHGEPGLMTAMGAFTDWSWEAPAVPVDPSLSEQAAAVYVSSLREALASSARPPCRPSMVGIPQDVAEQRWIPLRALLPASSASELDSSSLPSLDLRPVENAVRELIAAQRPVFLVDDYALRYPGFSQALDAVSGAVGGAVVQLRYRRGPMLFERLRTEEVGNFVGWLNQFSPAHRELLDACDLLVTLEDRNLYERVVGRLPGCRKVAINTDPQKVLKNEYLRAEDILIVGNPAQVLSDISEQLALHGARTRSQWFPARVREGSADTPEPAEASVVRGRKGLAQALAGVLVAWDQPVLVDDSQMFGGLLSEHYDDFPLGLRVFGGHGGFVGGGLAIATGLAIANDDVRVMCTLGDQGFTNAFQGLAAAVQERARVLFVVCNNGAAVSLRKQSAASYDQAPRTYLSNAPGPEYHAVARAMGLAAARVPVPIAGPASELRDSLGEVTRTLRELAQADGPSLLEVVLPADPELWRGIWITQGFERGVAAVAR